MASPQTSAACCHSYLLQEWVVALSFLPAWPADAEQWRPGLVQLWQQFMPAAAQQISWWMSQLAVPCSGEQQGRLDQQRQRLSTVCSVDYIQLIQELLGPVAGERTWLHDSPDSAPVLCCGA